MCTSDLNVFAIIMNKMCFAIVMLFVCFFFSFLCSLLILLLLLFDIKTKILYATSIIIKQNDWYKLINVERYIQLSALCACYNNSFNMCMRVNFNVFPYKRRNLISHSICQCFTTLQKLLYMCRDISKCYNKNMILV